MPHRRVITGVANGNEVVIDDAQMETLDLDGVQVTPIWQIGDIPTVPTDGSWREGVGFPDPGGLWMCTFTVPPHRTVEIGGDIIEFDKTRRGFHCTDSVDVDFVLGGEITFEIDDGSEVVLRAGDTIVVNGTRHAWHNRTDEPVTIMSTVYGARRNAS